MARHLWKLPVMAAMAMLSAWLNVRYGGQIRDGILNLCMNRARGTEGVDYANHLNPQKYQFRFDESGQLVRVGKKSSKREAPEGQDSRAGEATGSSIAIQNTAALRVKPGMPDGPTTPGSSKERARSSPAKDIHLYGPPPSTVNTQSRRAKKPKTVGGVPVYHSPFEK